MSTPPFVLVVEDEAALADLLKYNLEKEGYRVSVAADGEEALVLAQESPPDLVVLDWMLPKASGVEVCRRLRARQETRNTPIVMLTARGEESDRVRGLDTGADDYVTKPFSMNELLARLRAVMRRIDGAYSLVILTPTTLIAARDPMGNRPLALGRIGRHWVVASETCALDHLGATYVREVEPGEIILVDHDGLRSFPDAQREQRDALCIFEYTYFARPDSIIRDQRVYPIRTAMGRELAREHPVDADIVIGIPDSAIAAAIGYAREADIPYAEGLMKNRYVGRTFIAPDQRLRDRGAALKYNPLREVLEGQRVAVVDDSIVRGTTTPHVVKLLRDAGAREVHMRVCIPPIKHPCYFGVDMATRKELIGAQMSIEEMKTNFPCGIRASRSVSKRLSSI